MADQELVEEVRKLSKKGRSTDVIRNLLSKNHERAAVDEAVQYYIDNFIIKNVTTSHIRAENEAPTRNPVAVFFLGLLLFRGVLPPIIVFLAIMFFSAKFIVSRLFPLNSDPVILYFFLFFGFIIFFMQSGVLVLLLAVFKGSESVENPYSKALIMNIFIMVIGAATQSFFLFSQAKMNVVFLIIAPVLYLFLISFAYNIPAIRAFVPGLLMALINDILSILLLFTAGYVFLGRSILSF